jgi:pimeloyl-ACP methyl ester carboxylesterase
VEKKLNLNGYKCPLLINKVPGVPIVFLHGLSYSIKIWQRLGITDLTKNTFPTLPLICHMAKKSLCNLKTHDIEKNVTFAYEAIENIFGGPTAPVLVGTSIGGNIALHFASRFPVKGLVLVLQL